MWLMMIFDPEEALRSGQTLLTFCVPSQVRSERHQSGLAAIKPTPTNEQMIEYDRSICGMLNRNDRAQVCHRRRLLPSCRLAVSTAGATCRPKTRCSRASSDGWNPVEVKKRVWCKAVTTAMRESVTDM